MAAKASWFVYLIRCGDDSLYCGIATDVARRFLEHESQSPKCSKYLRGRLPLKLVYHREIGDRSQATKEELRIKALSKVQKLALAGNFNTAESEI
jgi:putative endonuclease